MSQPQNAEKKRPKILKTCEDSSRSNAKKIKLSSNTASLTSNNDPPAAEELISISNDIPSTLNAIPSISNDLPSTLKNSTLVSKDLLTLVSEHVQSTSENMPSTSKNVPSVYEDMFSFSKDMQSFTNDKLPSATDDFLSHFEDMTASAKKPQSFSKDLYSTAANEISKSKYTPSTSKDALSDFHEQPLTSESSCLSNPLTPNDKDQTFLCSFSQSSALPLTSEDAASETDLVNRETSSLDNVTYENFFHDVSNR